jgi:hypothetical protein
MSAIVRFFCRAQVAKAANRVPPLDQAILEGEQSEEQVHVGASGHGASPAGVRPPAAVGPVTAGLSPEQAASSSQV